MCVATVCEMPCTVSKACLLLSYFKPSIFNMSNLESQQIALFCRCVSFPFSKFCFEMNCKHLTIQCFGGGCSTCLVEQMALDGTGSPTASEILFDGVTFTTTDLNSHEKRLVADAVYSIGGKINNDLTSETNVLVVGNMETEKSKYCLKHRTDVTLIYPDDLFDIFKRFKEKSLTNLTIGILDEYPWPIFDSCLFCLSRLRDVSNPCYQKDYITRLIDHFGGKAVASLTPKVTYLITDKKEGKRYESALDWNIIPLHPKWIIDCCNCQRILNPQLYDISKLDNPKLLGKNSYKRYRNVVNYGSTENNPLFEEVNCEIQRKAQIRGRSTSEYLSLFKGYIFATYGFNDQQVEKLSSVLRTNGAEVQDEYDFSVTHVLIPSTYTAEQIPDDVLKLQSLSNTEIVNEWFIERCLHYKKIMNDSWSLPLPHLFLNYKLKIHITGFCDIEHLHVSKLIKNLKLTLSTELTQDCDYLVANLSSLGVNKSNSQQLFVYKYGDILTSKANMDAKAITLTKKKINSAKKWNIPVVSLAFIWELSQTGILPRVLDKKWCIFAPRSLKPASNFLEYARSVSGGTFQTQHDMGDVSDVAGDIDSYKMTSKSSPPKKLPTQLPSPRKNSAKKWPKLIGTASESQLKSNNVTTSDDNYEFKSARRLVFNDEEKNDNKIPRTSYVDFEDDFGIDDMPIFKKRRV